ncbi:death on curing protein [Cyclonatronum proteinivorum]|uniref:Death on curing protein n=1 Tax=Cyclonatronum proteinivorum TaxID=1457365 RepID=A0A345UHP3_9BACT|nr:death on curing protein [Cyclonatronum proteinivorum]
MYTFLYVNGYQITAEQASLFSIMMDLASGKVSKEALRVFLINNIKERD